MNMVLNWNRAFNTNMVVAWTGLSMYCGKGLQQLAAICYLIWATKRSRRVAWQLDFTHLEARTIVNQNVMVHYVFISMCDLRITVQLIQ